MSEMVERVARAISTERDGADLWWKDYVSEARAAILAMREPTPEMVSPGFFADAWRRAIDAVLRDE